MITNNPRAIEIHTFDMAIKATRAWEIAILDRQIDRYGNKGKQGVGDSNPRQIDRYGNKGKQGVGYSNPR